jgi:hypothetical protein
MKLKLPMVEPVQIQGQGGNCNPSLGFVTLLSWVCMKNVEGIFKQNA